MHLHTELKKKKKDRQKKKKQLSKSLKSWTQFESSPAEQLTETHWDLQMQIQPAAYVSLRKGIGKERNIYMNDGNELHLFMIIFSLVDAWMHYFFHVTLFFFHSGWRHHDNTASTSAMTPLHGCTLGVVLCPPTHWFPLMLLREPGLSLKATVAAEEEKGNGSSQWQRK